MKKKGDDEMNVAAQKQKQTDRQKRLKASMDKLMKTNGKALERLSKN
ncbi:hypothetical protein [Fictibacillus terranigra]|uniref:Uncharacterized protein n=1 Tax=Fictibacillus terranigra TaxID=3058424 RepID=A0ABT8EC87_9BACL|nr:hypothetical protein [Fictibacillus sp. CENA-BCM004]MDN4075454.1 hypothetical protein [Fictibacillus sp. CENA-BCM004]